MSEAAPAETNPAKKKDELPKQIFLVSYPKIVYLYPVWIMSLIAGIYMLVAGNERRDDTETLALVFLGILALNMIVLAFDFPRTTSLTLFFFCVAVGVVLWALFRFNPTFLPAVTNVLKGLRPFCNSTFYFCFFTMMTLIYIGVLISVQFDYWEVRPNELLHHHGFLSDMDRFSAPHMRIEKEISDVFEYFLLRGGRLILHASKDRPIVLDNVFFINTKEDKITRMLGALQVQVRNDES
ncbi:MAG TPA: hypothetical protein VLA12_05135 [Planctomycetaceae bacterium]|nr:hypothetical protein [Planctomycetaceae bacterium]